MSVEALVAIPKATAKKRFIVALTKPILSLFCFEPTQHFGRGDAPADPLRVLRAHFHGFDDLVRGKRVLDFGCGDGHQSAALAALGAHVTGLDTNPKALARARALYPHVTFTDHIPDGSFDFCVSQNAMEHFSDPKGVLQAMRRALKPKDGSQGGGKILATWGPPWWSPYGPHCDYFCRLPWVQLFFPESTIMAVRAKYRNDLASKTLKWSDVEGGMNKLSIRRWERILRELELKPEKQHYYPVAGITPLTKIPVIRELFIGHVSAVLAT
jgi:SAM-dependent methyltransferase